MAESEFDLNCSNSLSQNTSSESFNTDEYKDTKFGNSKFDLKLAKELNIPIDLSFVSDANLLSQLDLKDDSDSKGSKSRDESQNNLDSDLIKELSIPIELDPDYHPEPVTFDLNDLNIPIKYDYEEESVPTDLSTLVKKLDIPCDSEFLKSDLSDTSKEKSDSSAVTRLTRYRKNLNRGVVFSQSTLSSKFKPLPLKARLEPNDLTAKLDFRELSSKLDLHLPLASLDLSQQFDHLTQKLNTTNKLSLPLPLKKSDVNEQNYKKYLEFNETQLGDLRPLSDLKFKKKGTKQRLDDLNGIAPLKHLTESSPLAGLNLNSLEVSPVTVENWAQCENCKKWRRLPVSVDTEKLPDTWVCSLNVWDPVYNSCSVPEELYIDKSPDKLPEHKLPDQKFAQIFKPEHKAKAGGRHKHGSSKYNLLNTGTARDKRNLEDLYNAFDNDPKTPTNNNRYFEETSRKESSKRYSRDHLSPLVSNLSSYDEECEVVKFKMGRVDENNTHPLKDRLTLYSDSLTSLLATELPHSALFLDNLRKMNLHRDDEFNDDMGASFVKEKDTLFLKEDGTINLGYAYKTEWDHPFNQKSYPQNDSYSSRSREDAWNKMSYLTRNLKDLSQNREHFTRMYSRLSTQIPKVTDIVQLNKEEMPDFYERLSPSHQKIRTNTISTAPSISSVSNNKGNISNLISKNEVLDLLYNFAKQRQPLLQHLETISQDSQNQRILYPRSLSKSVDRVEKTESKLITSNTNGTNSTLGSSNNENSSVNSNNINTTLTSTNSNKDNNGSNCNDNEVDPVDGNKDNSVTRSNGTVTRDGPLTKQQLDTMLELKKLMYCTKYKYVCSNLNNIIKYKEQLMSRAEEMAQKNRELQLAQEREREDHVENETEDNIEDVDVEENDETEKDSLDIDLSQKEPSLDNQLSEKELDSELIEKEMLMSDKKHINHHLDYPLPNIKQLSKRCRNLDHTESKLQFNPCKHLRDLKSIEKYNKDVYKNGSNPETYQYNTEKYPSRNRGNISNVNFINGNGNNNVNTTLTNTNSNKDYSNTNSNNIYNNYSMLFQPIPDNLNFNRSSQRSQPQVKEQKGKDLMKMLSIPITYKFNEHEESSEKGYEKGYEKEFKFQHFDNINLLSLPIPEFNSNGTNNTQYVI